MGKSKEGKAGVQSRRQNGSVLNKLLHLQDSDMQHFETLWTQTKSAAIECLQGKEGLIETIWSRCLATYKTCLKQRSHKKDKILSMLASLRKSNWMTLQDKLNSSNKQTQSTVHIDLLLMLVQESISKEKASKHFWTPAYKELSENLSLLTEIDSVDSGLNYSNTLFERQEEPSRLLEMRQVKAQSKNLHQTSWPLYMSSHADKWAGANTNVPESTLKSLKVPLYPTVNQKKKLDQWLNTSRYVYNKALEYAQKHKCWNFQALRNALVSNATRTTHPLFKKWSATIAKLKQRQKELVKGMNAFTLFEIQNMQIYKDLQKGVAILEQKKKTLPIEQNTNVLPFELDTPKEIRAGAVNDVYKAFTTCIAKLKKKQIRFFNLKYRTKKNKQQTMLLQSSLLKLTHDGLVVAPQTLKKAGVESLFKVGKQTMKKLQNVSIKNDCRIMKNGHKYFVFIPVPYKTVKPTKDVGETHICGIDLGIKDFATCYGTQGIHEITLKRSVINKLNAKLVSMKKAIGKNDDSDNGTENQCSKQKHIRRRAFNKVEERKVNVIDHLHWSAVHYILSKYDMVFLGNISSHILVKEGKSKKLNRDINDMKFYQFKARLQYKAKCLGKVVHLVPEHYTSQCCSTCGYHYKPTGKEYICKQCKKVYGRDINAAKNILMKGLLSKDEETE